MNKTKSVHIRLTQDEYEFLIFVGDGHLSKGFRLVLKLAKSFIKTFGLRK